MKTRTWWLFQLPFILLFAVAYLVWFQGYRGTLTSPFVRTTVLPALLRIQGFGTDVKFRVRGPLKRRNKIVIVAVDSNALDKYGRWPWRRDVLSRLIERVYSYSPRAVGLDMVFSEKEGARDKVLEQTIKNHQDNLVLGWVADLECQPRFFSTDRCPVGDPLHEQTHPADFARFADRDFLLPSDFAPQTTAMDSAVTMIANLPDYNAVAVHQGHLNANLEPDGTIRRTAALMIVDGSPQPSLPLEMARVGLAGKKMEVPLSPEGFLSINFRGPQAFPYVSAVDVMNETVDDQVKDRLRATLKDAYVFIGVTAIGVFDQRSFPFGPNVPGVEGHASVLDNLLSGDAFQVHEREIFWVLFFMTVGAAGFTLLIQRLEALWSFVAFVVLFAGILEIDTHFLFAKGHNWNTSLLYLEMGFVLVSTLAIKYFAEERNKKFLRGAFSRYVSPAVVDSIIRNPDRLSLGGEKKELTVLFSDIRGFTTISESMEPRELSSFLNEYFGLMTKIIFDQAGTLDKYIGDAIMAFWGAPTDQPDHAWRASWASVKMIKELEAHREKFKAGWKVDFNIGIGLVSGPASVGNMGTHRNFNYTAIGDTVNLASRLESLTKVYGTPILTDRATLDHIARSGLAPPPYRIVDVVKVKGKLLATEIAELLPAGRHEGHALFEEARALYLAKNWERAATSFEKAQDFFDKHGSCSDRACDLFVERCNILMAVPPAQWDGTWQMEEK